MKKTPTQILFEELEREGVIERTGKFKVNPETGEPRPCFVLVPELAAIYGEGAEGLERYIRTHYEFVPTTH
jgi:hypothetical protein